MRKSGRIRPWLFHAGILLNLLWLCSCATKPSAQRSLPADVRIDQDAGSGKWLIVTIQLDDGQKLPVVVDTGSGATFLSTSLGPKLGKRLGTAISFHWGNKETNGVYTAPKLYLAGAQLLMTGDAVFAAERSDLRFANNQKLMGILGMDVLEHYCIQLDFAAHEMRFLDSQHADKSTWGKAFPIVPLNDEDPRPAIAENVVGLQGPHSLIDSGYLGDGWLMPKHYQSWTNNAASPTNRTFHWPNGRFGGEKYFLFDLDAENVESDGLGLSFLARHLVTLDFPNHTLYLNRQSIGPRPNVSLADYKPIPDREPEVTAHLRAMLQDWYYDTSHTNDYTAGAWKNLLTKQKDLQAFTKNVGDIDSMTLVERSDVFGWWRSYRYRIEFARATVLAHFIFHGPTKLASGTMTIEGWKEPGDSITLR